MIKLDKISELLRPDEKEVMKSAGEFLRIINAEVKKKKLKATAVVGGSVAKGTFLKGDADVDIFVKFDRRYETGKLADYLERCLKKLSYSRIHGSRDYFQIKQRGLNYEIVPVYKIKNIKDAVNITDASPFHVEWVGKQIKKNPKLADEIRLAKAFFKSIGVYGAESYIRGFSGYVVEILVINYKGFVNLLRATAKWKDKQIIDIYNVHKGNALFDLNKAKTESPLVLIDPTQPDRNAAASLSEEKFSYLMKEAKKFLKNPSENAFKRKGPSLEQIRKQAKQKGWVLLEATLPEGKEDVIGSKLLKVIDYLRSKLMSSGFKIRKSGWMWNRRKSAHVWFVADGRPLSKTREAEGPPVKFEQAVINFKKKHKRTFVRGGRVFAVVERKFTKADELLAEAIKDEYVKERVEKMALEK